MKDLIPRQTYIERMMPFLGSRVIKVVTGMRRCGKSSFLRMFMRHLVERGMQTADGIVHVDLEALENAGIRTAGDLAERIKARTKPGTGRTLLFIDEVQYVEGWERAVAAFAADSERYEVFLSGSSAKLFSGELATRLSGRYVEFPMLPLSLGEFMRFSGLGSAGEAFPVYLRYGALPGIHDFRELSDETVFPYLRSVYDSILVKDILERNNIRNVRLAQDVVCYLFDNIGNLTSASRLADYLKSQRRGASVTTLLGYLGQIADANLAVKLPRWDVRGKRHLEVSEKYYATDLGLRHALLGYRPADIGGLLENLVCLHLFRGGWRVSVGRLPDGREIDFVAESDRGRLYVQVAASALDPATLARELAPLRATGDDFPKLLLTLDEVQPDDFDGIRHVRVPDFLLADPVHVAGV